MPDPLNVNPSNNDPLGATRLAMADVPPEVPPSGGMPPGKTKPSAFLLPMREPPAEAGGAPERATMLKGNADNLIKALDDEVAFPAEFAKLEALTTPDLKVLAQMFTGMRTTSRAQALASIKYRHDSLMAAGRRNLMVRQRTAG